MKKGKEKRELKAYAIGDENFYQVVISHSKDIAWYWLRDIAGYSKEKMATFKIWDFPLDRKVLIKDYKEISAREVIEEVILKGEFVRFPIVAFEKESNNDYFTNWHSDC